MKVRMPAGKKFGTFIKPMLAETREQPFDDAGWVFEIKHDGYRAIAEIENGEVKLYSRKGLDYIKTYPKVYEALRKMTINAILDGEIVVVDDSGRSSFQKLQNYSPRSSANLLYYVFDCLSLNGQDLKSLPLVQRKELLQKLVGDSTGVVRYCDHIEEQGKALFEHAAKLGIEGIIGKRANSRYINDRSSNWLKIKHKITGEFIVVGFLPGRNSRKYFGGLLMAEEIEGEFHFRGQVGTGFTDQKLKEVHELLIPHQVKKSPLAVVPKLDGVPTWVEPKFTVKVKYSEITEENLVRHPVFLSIK